MKNEVFKVGKKEEVEIKLRMELKERYLLQLVPVIDEEK